MFATLTVKSFYKQNILIVEKNIFKKDVCP